MKPVRIDLASNFQLLTTASWYKCPTMRLALAAILCFLPMSFDRQGLAPDTTYDMSQRETGGRA